MCEALQSRVKPMTIGIGLNNGPYFCLRHSGACDGEIGPQCANIGNSY